MVNPKHHEWATFQMLYFSVLNFYCLQAELFLLKMPSQFVFNKDILPMIFHLTPHIEHM